MRKWLRDRQRELARSRAARKLAAAGQGEPTELREFVYVNDVALYSLFTSLIGPLADSFTDAQSQSLSTSVDAAAEVGNELLAKGSIRASLESNRSASRQLLRRATVQSNFRSFLGTARHLIEPARDISDTSSVTGSVDVIAAEKISRGRLLEFDVQLRSQWLFELVAAVDSMGALVGVTGDELESIGGSQFLEAMRELFVGLVPIEATVLGWKAVTSSDSTVRLVSDRALEKLDSLEKASAREVRVVGSVSEVLFWRDIRTVLFDSQKFRVLARVKRDDVADSWNSLKLLDVLRSVRAANIDAEIDRLVDVMSAPPASEAADQNAVAQKFAAELVRRHNWDESIGLSIPIVGAMPSEFEERREWFDALAATIAADRPIDRDVLADSRNAALGATDSSMSDSTSKSSVRSTGGMIEVEFIAIYW